jgi:hypothetical protein
MDLTKLSDADLLALKAGDYSKMSDGGLQALKASSAPQESPGYASDIMRSADAGIGKGLTTLLGLPGDAASLAHSVAPQSVIDNVKAIPGAQFLYNHLPGSEALKSTIPTDFSANYNKDAEYDPQTAPGRYTKAIAAQAPMMATGMGPLAAVAGGVGGQIAYDATGSHLAEAGGNLAGSIAAPLALARMSRQAMQPLLNANQVKGLSNADYANPLIRDTAISPQATQGLAGDMQAALDGARSRFSPAQAPRTTADIGRLAEAPNPVGGTGPQAPVSIEDLHNFRKSLRETGKEVGANFRPTEEAAAAGRAQRVLNQYLENIPSQDVVRGNPIDAVDALNRAGRNWRAYSGADQFGNIIENAQLRAGGQGSGANFGNLMRQETEKLLKNGGVKSRQLGADANTMDLLRTLNQGDFATNLLRRASNYTGGGGGIANHAAAALFGHAAGPVGYVLGATVGPALRAASNARTLGTARRVQDALLQNAPVNASIAARNNAARAANSAAYSNAVGRNGIPNALLQAAKVNRIYVGPRRDDQ